MITTQQKLFFLPARIILILTMILFAGSCFAEQDSTIVQEANYFYFINAVSGRVQDMGRIISDLSVEDECENKPCYWWSDKHGNKIVYSSLPESTIVLIYSDRLPLNKDLTENCNSATDVYDGENKTELDIFNSNGDLIVKLMIYDYYAEWFECNYKISWPSQTESNCLLLLPEKMNLTIYKHGN